MSNQANDPNQDQPKSQVPPVVPAGKPKDLNEKLDLLLHLLATKEARIAEEEEAKEVARRARNAQREKSSAAHVEKQLVKQARCRHLKGGKLGPVYAFRDVFVTEGDLDYERDRRTFQLQWRERFLDAPPPPCTDE